MDVMNALRINGTSFKVTNETDYYLDQWLYSDYGFELYYRPRRGMNQLRWTRFLMEYKFDEPDLYRKGIHFTETRHRSLNFHDFITRPFVVHFVHGSIWYGFAFDGNEFFMQHNHNNLHLPTLIL